MQVDREVVAEKYRRELAILRARYQELAQLGCYIVREEFPNIDVIVTPTQQVAFGMPSLRAPGVPPEQGLLHTYNVPPRFSFTLMAFGIRINLEDYDLRAPSYSFRYPTSWMPMPAEQLPNALLESEGKELQVLLGNHPITKGAFFCMRGVREYHEHPEHTGDEWLLYRGAVNVYATLTRIVRCCQKPLPIVLLGPPSLQVQFGSREPVQQKNEAQAVAALSALPGPVEDARSDARDVPASVSEPQEQV